MAGSIKLRSKLLTLNIFKSKFACHLLNHTCYIPNSNYIARSTSFKCQLFDPLAFRCLPSSRVIAVLFVQHHLLQFSYIYSWTPQLTIQDKILLIVLKCLSKLYFLLLYVFNVYNMIICYIHSEMITTVKQINLAITFHFFFLR